MLVNFDLDNDINFNRNAFIFNYVNYLLKKII